MVLKIYDHAEAPLVRLVAVVCKEKEVPYEVVNVAVYQREHKTPAFRRFQPFGQVPYIDDDGFVLYESRAICRYLVKKHEGRGTAGLIPKDPEDEALFEQAASVEYANFHPFALGLTTELIIKKRKGVPVDEARMNEYLQELDAKLDAYDDILGRQSYMAGQNVTLADLFHLPYAAILIEELGHNLLENRPNVARWWAAISTRQAWQAVKARA